MTVFELRADATDPIIYKPKTEDMNKSRLLFHIARFVAANEQVGNFN